MSVLLVILTLVRCTPELQYSILYKTEKECLSAATVMTKGYQVAKCVPMIKSGDFNEKP